MRILLHHDAGHDQLIWHFSSDGTYTVKSGYMAYMSNKDTVGVAATTMILQDIWKTAMLNKYWNFMWRAAQLCLLTQVDLKHQNVVEDASCPICSLHEQTTLHILCECNLAVNVWQASG